MKQEFKESYLGEIVSWREAEDKLLPYKDEMTRDAFVKLSVNQVMTAFLVIGKVAVLDDDKRDNDLAKLAVDEAKGQIEHALKTQGAFTALPLGHKIKVALLRLSPELYLKLYGRHKGKG